VYPIQTGAIYADYSTRAAISMFTVTDPNDPATIEFVDRLTTIPYHNHIFESTLTELNRISDNLISKTKGKFEEAVLKLEEVKASLTSNKFLTGINALTTKQSVTLTKYIDTLEKKRDAMLATKSSSVDTGSTDTGIKNADPSSVIQNLIDI